MCLVNPLAYQQVAYGMNLHSEIQRDKCGTVCRCRLFSNLGTVVFETSYTTSLLHLRPGK